MFTYDLSFIIRWWAGIFLVGVIGFPLTSLIFRRFFDRGYAFSKTVSLLLVTYIIFIGATLRVFEFSRTNLFVLVGLFLALNLFILYKKPGGLLTFIKKNIWILLLEEMLFAVGLLGWSYIRGFQPDIRGLEKFMDYGFLNSILSSRYLPPEDMWFAGKHINYYWFGHLWTAVITRLAFVPSSIAYNLMLGTILGLASSQSFSLVANLVKGINLKSSLRVAVAAGLISAIILPLGGNFHTPFFVWKNGGQKYWYPDATRFIGYNPETNDKTIHEFPLYSFVVSDLHAHVLDIPVVIAFLALVYALLPHLLSRSYLPFYLSLSGFFLGIIFATNTWDFASHSMTAGLIIFIYYLFHKKFSVNSILSAIVIISVIAILGVLFALPFIINFNSIAQGIGFTHTKTPIWQLLILWGFPAILTLLYFPFVFKDWSKIRDSDIFVLSLLISGWVLIFIPEIIYVKDIYIGSYYRANTMFKITYQAFVLFYLSGGFIILRIIENIKNKLKKILVAFFSSSLIYLVLMYPYFAIKTYYGELKKYSGLSGDRWVQDVYPHEAKVIEWFKNNLKEKTVILEAPGDSYTDKNLISAYTGLPTISGWFVHEWLWRGSADEPAKRVAEIETVYTTDDVFLTKEILKKYRVEYVIVGDTEITKYPLLKENKFLQIGELVYSDGINIYKIN